MKGGQFFKKDIPRYFKSIEEEETIAAVNASEHPSLIEFRTGYLDVLDIRSMLDTPFFLDGKVGGVICCEHQGEEKSWTREDVDFVKSVADIVTIAFKSARSRQLLLESQQHLEEVRAQEEELRQNMEEMHAIQEDLARKSIEIENVRKVEKERADLQIESQKKIMAKVMEKFKAKEEGYLTEIARLRQPMASQN